MDAKSEIRARLNIEDIIGEYVELKRSGRNFKGLSPFNSERTPSFIVSPEKQIWHDFSSNRGGDVFGFVMAVEGMDFRQALEYLARKAGVDLTQYSTEKSRETARRKKRLLEAHVLAARFFQYCMTKQSHAQEYIFKKRRLSKQVVAEFQIGYAPNARRALADFLQKRGFTKAELENSGLLNRYGGDLFRGRMTVPLMDASGQVIGFTGRIIGDVENAPKYLNTPQTLLYDKGRHVFGLSQAKEAIRKQGYVVIVEGNLDVVSSHQVDIKQVVATAGTAMTESHIKSLKRLTNDIRLAFDGDRAGIAATERSIAIASQVGVSLTIISMPDGAKDPDELIQEDPRLWQQAIEQTQPAVDWVLAQYKKQQDLTTAAGKRAFTTAGLKVVAGLQDPVEREHYEEVIAGMIGSTRAAIQAKLAQVSSEAEPKPPLKEAHTQEKPTSDKQYEYQDRILAALLLHPDMRATLSLEQSVYFDGEHRQAVARWCAESTDVVQDTPKDLHNYANYVKILLVRADADDGTTDEATAARVVAHGIRQLQHEHQKQKRDDLSHKLREAEDRGDEAAADALRIQLNTLIKEIARGQR